MKRIKINRIARDEEESDDLLPEASFAPLIEEETEKTAPRAAFFDAAEDLAVTEMPSDALVGRIDGGYDPEEPATDGEEREELPPDDGSDGVSASDGPETETSDPQVSSDPNGEEEDPSFGWERMDGGDSVCGEDSEHPAVGAADVGDSGDDEEAQALFTELCALPLHRRVYGLYGKDLLLSCPNERGGVYLFDRNGVCLSAAPDECAAFIRLCGAEGYFRNKRCRTSDLSYLLDEQSFPLSFIARNREQYDLSLEDGYLPYETAANGRGARMIKPLSLYRMKDLMLRVEYADAKNGVESDEYLIDADRSSFEGPGGYAQFLRLGRACAETVAASVDPFFSVQILKVRKNLVVCFPMDGRPLVGDLLADEKITDMTQMDDGALLLKLGSDESLRPDLKEGDTVKGQHRIVLRK